MSPVTVRASGIPRNVVAFAMASSNQLDVTCSAPLHSAVTVLNHLLNE